MYSFFNKLIKLRYLSKQDISHFSESATKQIQKKEAFQLPFSSP